MKINTARYHLQQAYNSVSKANKALGDIGKRSTITHFILESKRSIKALLDIDFEQIQERKETNES